MIFPALIYFFINKGLPTIDGWGIPIATDIAFALGIMMLLGSRVPVALKVFLVAVAVVDDLGAVMVIAVFYTSKINVAFLVVAALLLLLLVFLNKKGVVRLAPYLLIGAGLWYCFLMSGVHATIAGVLLALTIPTRKDHDHSPLHILEHSLSTPVAVLIMPLFAMANTAIPLESDIVGQITEPGGSGIVLGLMIGKPLGVILFSFLVVKLNIANRPAGVSWGGILSAGFFAGIGFTMSIFIANLAFADAPELLETSKVSIIAASVVSAVVGMILLSITTTKKTSP
jgi:NhaA family Na+:H+ antiporter